jgi:hypothetical protein
MPSNYSAILFGSLPLIAGGPDPSKSYNSYQRFESELHCEQWPGLQGVDHHNLPCIVEHYVPKGEAAPVENALAFCSGHFQVVMEDQELRVKIKSNRLQM